MSSSVWLFLYRPRIPPPPPLPLFPSHYSGVSARLAQLAILSLYLSPTMAGFVAALKLWHQDHQDQRVQSHGLARLKTA